MGKKVENLVAKLVVPIVDNYGLELVDVEYNKEGSDWILRIFIDREEGIKLEDCQQISRDVSVELDAKDPISQSYLLEVSSPGIDRPLKKRRDYERHKGKKVALSTYAPINGEKKFSGKLLGIEDDDIKIIVDGDEISIPYSKVAQTRLAIEF